MQNERDDARTVWAEAIPVFGPDTQIYSGEGSRDALAELLDETPAADEREVSRRLRGRPGLDANAPRGTRSPQLHVRITEDDAELIQLHVQRAQLKNGSELVRRALSEYFANHRLTA